MNRRALLSLFARPSVVATFGLLALLIAAIKLLDLQYGRDVPVLMFVVVYNAAVGGFVLSFGVFLARVTAELERIRIGRTIPGLRRKISEGAFACVLLVPALGTIFLRVSIPDQFVTVPMLTQWTLYVFLCCLGLGLGWSWLMQSIVGLLLIKIPTLLLLLRTVPWMSAAAALAAGGVLLAIGHSRFLRPFSANSTAWHWRWLNSPFAPPTTLTRKSDAPLRDRPSWRLPDCEIYSLVCAGAYERLGHRRGQHLGALATWTGLVFLIFGLLIFSASKDPRSGGFSSLMLNMFSADRLQGFAILRHLFAALIGGVAYVAAITLDGTLRASLWHPVSRRRQATAVFLSHLRLNFCFAAMIAALSIVLCVICARVAGVSQGFGAIRAFVMPAVFAFTLMPIPQVLFPNGPDAFHRRLNPLKQLGAGLLGAGISLLTIYWTSHWPLAGWSDLMPLWMRVSQLLILALAIYTGYFIWLRHRYARADLRRRTA